MKVPDGIASKWLYLRIATDARCSVSVAELLTHHTVRDVMDLNDALDFRDLVEAGGGSS